jgi:PAS domain S-box-containing protein
VAAILVLDDRAVERELLEAVLRSAGHTVAQASNGEEALARARAEHHDLIIADILMPGMDGYEFVRALREDTATVGARVILCTALYDQQEVEQLARACGVEHVLIKPVEPEEILEAVDAALGAAPRDAKPAQTELEGDGRFEREQLRAANAKLIEKLTELERAEEVRRLLAAIVESSEDAIIAKSLDGRIASWNRGAEKLYGYSAEEAIGEPISMLTAPEHTDELTAIMEQIRRGEEAPRVETVHLRKDGSTVDVAITISPMFNDSGQLSGAATIARDVSVRKQAERELAAAHATALATARAKTEFVTNMSHQIRTPLNGVIGMTRLLADTALDQMQREHMDALEASNEALLAVAEDVLEFSTLEAGRIELDATRFDCRSAVEEAVLMLSASARAKGLGIGARVDDDVPVTVRGDRTRLRQVLMNLLSNAVKFTAAGEILLHVSVAGSELMRFAVCDTGVGIEEGSADSLFEAFAQADQSTARRHAGTGLGLAIARQLVTRMGGQIGAERREGGGSIFWFTASLPAATMNDGPARSQPELSGLRALIVGDGDAQRAAARVVLHAPAGDDADELDPTIIAQLRDTLTSEMRGRLLQTFEQSLGKCLTDIASAAQSRDRIELRRLAHLLKGSSASMGAARLSRGCQQLEQLSCEEDRTVGQELLDELNATASAAGPALRRELL